MLIGEDSGYEIEDTISLMPLRSLFDISCTVHLLIHVPELPLSRHIHLDVFVCSRHVAGSGARSLSGRANNPWDSEVD